MDIALPEIPPPDGVIHSHKMAVMEPPTVYLLDYVAGNIRSLVNAIERIGYRVQWIKEPGDIANAEVCFD